MARSFVVVAFLVFALCFSSVLARKAPGVEPSGVNRKAPRKAPLAGPKAPLKAPLAGPKAPLAGPKAPLKAPLAGPKAPQKAPLKAPLAGPKAPLAGPKAPRKEPRKAPLAGPKAPHARPFTVVGQIYCDPCRFEVMSRRSTPLEGVKVNLECRKADSNKVTYVKEGKTDANGAYKILVGGDHKDEICEVKPEPTGNGKCTEPMTKKSDRIVFTKNSSMTRIANPLGFMTKATDGKCRKEDKELNLDLYVEA